MHRGLTLYIDAETLRQVLLKARDEFDLSPPWGTPYEVIRELFAHHPSNREFESTRLKIATLDASYGTRLSTGNTADDKAIDLLAKWMGNVAPSLDTMLSRGDLEAVKQLESGHPVLTRAGKTKNLWSFATKFAHFSNPGAFAIWGARANHSITEIHAIRPSTGSQLTSC